METLAPTRRRRTILSPRWPLLVLTVVLLLVGSAAVASANNQWPARVVAGATTSANTAVWSVEANGTVTAYFPGTFHGDAFRLPLAEPITGMAATATGKGYWLVATDGGIFTFGVAHFYGSMAATHLNQPVVGIAATKDGHGYWLVASDGGIFTFGDAHFFGSLGGIHLNQPIVGIAASRSGNGYRLVARDGGVFTFGDATYRGSLGGRGIADVVGLAPTPSGNGYWILRRSGGTYFCSLLTGICPAGMSSGSVSGPSVANFGDARNFGEPLFPNADAASSPRPSSDYNFVGNPIVGIVANPGAQGYAIFRANPKTVGVAGTPPGE